MRQTYIVGNWKMNCGLREAMSLVDGIGKQLGAAGWRPAQVGIAPPAIWITSLRESAKKWQLDLGAQNMHFEKQGAFTGELSPTMLTEAGCDFVIIGHSERRHVFGETSQWLQKKVKAALNENLKVIYCIGETLEQRESGQTQNVVIGQLKDVLDGHLDWQKITIAYEPVWAIGTGKNASPEQAQEVHHIIRNWLQECFGDSASNQMRIQYGGSVKSSNAQEILGMPDVDGALVGGASLKPDDFLGIIQAAPTTK